jgi:hypothetical protein
MLIICRSANESPGCEGTTLVGTCSACGEPLQISPQGRQLIAKHKSPEDDEVLLACNACGLALAEILEATGDQVDIRLSEHAEQRMRQGVQSDPYAAKLAELVARCRRGVQ